MLATISAPSEAQDLQSAMVRSLGVPLSITRRGRGQSLLCLHAAGHGARDFIKVAGALADGFETISVDFPGHGESPPEKAPVSAERYGRLAMGVADALDLSRFMILGNSIGGAAAIHCGAAHPQRVRALVLCNPGGLQRVGLLAKGFCRAKASFFASADQNEARFLTSFRRYYEREVLPQTAAAWRREEIIATGGRIAPVLAQAWRSFAEPSADIRHLTPKLAMPVLYAWARQDALVAWGRSKAAALRAPKAEAVFLEAGHCAFLEQPEAFLAAFRDFAARAPA